MLADVIGLLECPACTGALTIEADVVRCPAGHSYDVARQGYVNLLPGGARPGTADTAEMVRARSAFLDEGHLEPLSVAIRRFAAVVPYPRGGVVVDAGAGTGHHLAAVLRDLPGAVGVALDISKHAARHAARAYPRIGAVVCDAWSRLPVADGAADVVLNVFAPRNAAEFRRVLAREGSLITATPAPRHLEGVAGPLGLIGVQPQKDLRVREALGGHFAPAETVRVEYSATMTAGQAETLVRMGPSARHVSGDALAVAIAGLDWPTEVVFSFDVTRWALAPDR